MKAEAAYRTEPPDVARRSLKRRAGEMLSRLVMPLIAKAARPYLGGETIEDALCVAQQITRAKSSASFSYWDRGEESLHKIEARAASALEALSAMQPQSYLSLKAPALRYSTDAALKIAQAAAQHGIGLHFDSHGAETVERSNHLIDAMAKVISPEMLGTTLPSALARSAGDAEWAIARGFSVRVVKGAWPDPSDPKRDLDRHFLDLIERLAGRARHVRVGTHNYALGRQAVERLTAAGTSCEIETLLGLPAAALIGWARQNGVKSRVYIPYGPGYLPNAMGVLRRNPRLAWTIAKAQIRVFSNAKAPRRSVPAPQSPASLSRSES